MDTLTSSSDRANCCFCARYNPVVQVICEGKCLICSICMRATSIRKLLTASVAECTGIEQALCPVCDYPMAPNTVIAIKNFPVGVDSMTETDFSEFINPFLFYYQKLKLEYSYDHPTDHVSPETKSLLTKNCAALYGMEELVCNRLSGVGLLDFIADIFCSVSACCVKWKQYTCRLPSPFSFCLSDFLCSYGTDI